MLTKDKAIVIQKTQLAEKKCLVKLFTLGHGFIESVCFASNAPSSKVKVNTLWPLALIEVELLIRQNKDIHQLKETQPYFISANTNSSLLKLNIVQLISEILSKTIKVQHGNKELYNFIEELIIQIDQRNESELSNVINYFLIELTTYLGIEPQNNFSVVETYFDCKAGEFTKYGLVMPLGFDAELSETLSFCLKNNKIDFKLNAKARKDLIDGLLAYYSFHIPNFGHVRSLDVIRELII